MKNTKLLLLLLLIVPPIYGQKILDSKIEFKKDCSNCKFILKEAGKAYSLNYKEAIEGNSEIHLYIKKLIDFKKVSNLKLRAERAYKSKNMKEYYQYFEELKYISSKYISDFTAKTKGDAYIYIDLRHIKGNTLEYNIYVDSGVKYGSIRIYYNLQTNNLAHIKVDDLSYKSFMNKKTETAKNIKIWTFEDFETLAYTVNNDTKADKDFTSICEDFIEYESSPTIAEFSLINAKTTTTTHVTIIFKNCFE